MDVVNRPMAKVARKPRRFTPRRLSVAGRKLDAGERVDGAAVFDRQARRTLNISGNEFMRRWEAGAYRRGEVDPDKASAVRRLVLLLPLVRRTRI